MKIRCSKPRIGVRMGWRAVPAVELLELRVRLGVMLFFDRGLLSMGNILFLSGVTTTIGPRRTYKFFKRNGKGTAAFMSGVALVFVGWPFFGMLVEGYGFLVLFSSFFPTVLLFLKRLPVVGTFLSLPGVKNVVTSLVGKTQTLPV